MEYNPGEGKDIFDRNAQLKVIEALSNPVTIGRPILRSCNDTESCNGDDDDESINVYQPTTTTTIKEKDAAAAMHTYYYPRVSDCLIASCIGKICFVVIGAGAFIISFISVVGFETHLSSLDTVDDGGHVERIPRTTMVLREEHISLPDILEHNLSNATVGYTLVQSIPFFLSVLETGGQSMQRISKRCLNLVDAREDGKSLESDKEIRIHTYPGLIGGHFRRSADKGFSGEGDHNLVTDLDETEMGLIQIYFSPELYQSSSFFNQMYQGRVFLFLRHPVDRAVLSYFDSTSRNARKSKFTLFVRGGKLENNYVTRLIVNKHEGELQEKDLFLAMEFMRRKCIVGLAEQMFKSVLRFSDYFGWNLDVADRIGCLNEVISREQSNLPMPWTLDEDSELWNMIVKENFYDMSLYEYAQKLFQEQEELFKNERETT